MDNNVVIHRYVLKVQLKIPWVSKPHQKQHLEEII